MIVGITGSIGGGEKCAGYISQDSLRDIVSSRNNVSNEWTVPVRKGETAWEAVARPCLQLCEHLKQSGDKVYRTCKVPVPVLGQLSLSK